MILMILFSFWLDWDYQQDRQQQGWLLQLRGTLCFSEVLQFVSTFLPQHCTEAPGNKSKTSHHQIKNSSQYLISGVSPIIEATGDNHLLVEVSSSKTIQRPGKLLLCTEQHFWKVHTSRCICTGIIMRILMLIVLQLYDGFKYCHDIYIIA